MNQGVITPCATRTMELPWIKMGKTIGLNKFSLGHVWIELPFRRLRRKSSKQLTICLEFRRKV